MSQEPNPESYEAFLSDDETLVQDSRESVAHEPIVGGHAAAQTTGRPFGVAALAALHFFGGLVLFWLQFLLFSRLDAIEPSAREAALPMVLVATGLMFLAILSIASGIGMWRGTTWGWWMGSFYYVYAIFRNASALLTAASMAEELENSERGLIFYLVKHSIRILVSFLFLSLFFKENVLDFFGMNGVDKRQSIARLFGIGFAVSSFGSIIAWVATW